MPCCFVFVFALLTSPASSSLWATNLNCFLFVCSGLQTPIRYSSTFTSSSLLSSFPSCFLTFPISFLCFFLFFVLVNSLLYYLLKMASTDGLANRAQLDRMDKLRELGIQELVPLPQVIICDPPFASSPSNLSQMVVVGDQSAGKSSVLESLTGFHFPRSVTLCTRHATEIICRRESTESIVISIQAVDADAEKAKEFRRSVSNLDAPEFEKIFRDVSCEAGSFTCCQLMKFL